MKSLFTTTVLLKSISFCLLLSLLACSAPVMINTVEDLDLIRQDSAGNYKLMTDIAVENWQPIDQFNGVLDGNGYTITIKSIDTLFTSTNNNSGIGLIRTLGQSGVVKNLRTAGEIVCSGESTICMAGGIVACNEGTIENCMSQTDITVQGGKEKNIAGGIVAENNGGTIRNCYSVGNISVIGTKEAVTIAGGLAGINRGGISFSFTAGSVKSKAMIGMSFGGGLVGKNESGKIANSIAANSVVRVSGEDLNFFDLLVGADEGTIDNTYAWDAIKLYGKGYTKINEETRVDLSRIQNQNWWEDTLKFAFGTSEKSFWQWSTEKHILFLFGWIDPDFELGKTKTAGAYGLTSFDESQIYKGTITFEKSRNVEITMTLSPDATQITKLLFEAEELQLTPKHWEKRTKKEGEKKLVYTYTKGSTANSNFAITQTPQGYNVAATDASGNYIIDKTIFKGGLETDGPLDIIDEKVSSDIALLFELKVTDACIYGNIKAIMEGCGTPWAYVVLRNETTPEEIPSEILTP